ncbi:MAG: hypothetical protein IT260_09225 [Saprospiraceae bacterium]|nr:hypothetical protein [Saprospiraceae bacterium]
MTLPLTGLSALGLPLLASSLLALSSTVFTVSTNNPNELSPCQDTVFQITITNSSPQAQAAGTLQYCLPTGLAYTSASGLTPANVADPRCPVFVLPAMAGNSSLSFSLRVQVDCSAKDQGDLRDTIRISSGGMPQDPLLGSAYNLRVPVLSLTPGQNWDYVGSVGEVFTRSFTIRNEGFGAALHVYVIDSFSQAGLELIQTSGVFSGDTLQLSGLTLGPNGQLLFQDSVVVTQEFRITACANNAGPIAYGWGCPGGKVCTLPFFDEYTVSSGNSPAPILSVTQTGALQTPRPCEPVPLQMQVENSGNAAALDLEWVVGLSSGATITPEYWTKFKCYLLNNFSIGSSLLTDLAPIDPNLPHRLPLNLLNADPDGPGGLSDEDGDGQFDDLAPGNTVILNLTLGFEPGCKLCNDLIGDWYVGAAVQFSSNCGTTLLSTLPTNVSPGISFIGNKLTEDHEFILDAGSLADFTYQFDAAFLGLPGVCPDDSIIVAFSLPQVLQVPGGFQPYFDSLAVPFWTVDTTLYLLLPGATGDLAISLLTLCPPDIDDSGQCTPPYEPRTYQLAINSWWTCGNGCNQTVSLLCKAGDPFTIDCPRPDDTTQQHGIFADTILVHRTSLGFVDNERSAHVNAATPGLNLSVGIPYDTVLVQALASYEGTPGDFFDSSQVQLYYWNGLSEPYFKWLEASLVVNDVETGQALSCDNLSIQQLFINGYHIWEINLLPLTQPGGCLFAGGVRLTPGDKITVSVTARLSELLPLDRVTPVEDLRARFPYVYHGDSLLCEMKNTEFGVINPGIGYAVQHLFPEAVCDDLEVKVSFLQGNVNAVSEDIFPNEIRPLFVYDSLFISLSQGFVYRPGSSEWLYDLGDGATNVPATQTIPLPDPAVVTLPDGTEAFLYVRPGNFPVTDYYTSGAPAVLQFKAQTLCPPDTTKTPIRIVGHSFLATLDSINVNLNTGYTGGGPDFNELSLSALSLLSVSREPTWVIEYCNPSTSFTIPEPLIFVDNGPAIRVTAATDITIPQAPQPLSVSLPDSLHSIIQGLSLSQDQCRTIEIQADIQACSPDTLTLFPGFQCVGASPCVYNQPVTLYFIPKEGLAQINVTASPDTAIGLCDPIGYEITVINIADGNLYDLNLNLQLPQAGQVLVPGSCTVAYNSQVLPLPDPQAGPNGLEWNLDFTQPPFSIDFLPGVQQSPANALAIRFQLETNCSYIDGERFHYSCSWNNSCGDRQTAASFVAPPLLIKGAPTSTNDYQIQVQMTDPASFCAANTMRLSIYNPGNLGPTGTNEKLRIVLPPGFSYMAGSYQAILNGPLAGPTETPFGDETFLYFNVPPGVIVGDSIVFSIKIQNTTALTGCAAFYDFEVQMLQSANVACKNTNCDVDFILVSKNETTAFEKPAYALSGLAGSSLPLDVNQEIWHLDFGVQNLSATLVGGSALQVEIRLDADQNGQLDGSDPLVKVIGADVEGLLPGSIQMIQDSLNLNGLSGCSGLWVVLTDTTCSCAQDAVFIPFVLLLNAGPDRITCAGESIALGTFPQNNYQYEWIPASPWLSNAAVANPSYLYAGPFDNTFRFSETLVLKTTRPQGCVSYDTIQLATNQIDLSLTALDVLCHGDSTGSISSVLQGAEVPVQYAWNYAGSTSPSLAGLPAGNYTLQVQDTLGCHDEASVTITEPAALTLVLDTSVFHGYGISCAGQTDGFVQATAGGGVGGYQINWSVAGSSGPQLNNLGAGTYTATLTDANGCSLIKSATLTAPEPLALTAMVQDQICPDTANGSIRLIVQGGAKPYTANGTAISTSFYWGPLGPGMYSVLVKDANGCSLVFDTTLIARFSTFSAQSDSVSCFGGTDGMAAVTGSGYPPFEFSWSNSMVVDSFLTGAAGTYTCTVLDALGCFYHIPVDIPEPGPLTGTAIPVSTLCFNDSTGQINLSVSGGNAPFTYTIDGQPTTMPVTGLPIGAYSLQVTDAKGCTLELSATVDQPTPVALALSPMDAICFDSPNGQISAQGSGGVPPYTYLWSTGASGAVLDSVPAGAYALTMSDANGCSLTDSTSVAEPEPYMPDFQIEHLPCADERNGILSVSGFPPGTLYGLDQAALLDTAWFERVGGGLHVLHITDPLGCRFTFDYDMPTLAAELGLVAPDTAIHLGDSVLLSIEPHPDLPPDAGLTYQWINPLSALSACDTCPTLWVQPFRTAYYTVQFLTADGCTWEDRALVQVLRDSVYAPNVLYGDAANVENQFFTLYGRPSEITMIKSLRVFDRWGEALFERTNFAPNDFSLGWDGTYRGTKLDPGVFVWFAEVEYIDVERVKLAGDVTLLR